jgi:hypothetical protein
VLHFLLIPINKTTGESCLIEKSVIRTQEIISLMTNSAVMIDLTFQFYVRVIAVMSSFTREGVLRNCDIKWIFG